MKTIFKNYIFLYLSLGFVLFTSCDSITDFEDFQNNPNETTQATPGLILTDLQISAFNGIDLGAAYASRYAVDINVPQDEQYYLWNRGGFSYHQLRQALKMKEEARRLDNETMVTIADLMQVYIFHQMTRRFGDIPYEEALQAEEGIDQPEYTRQEVIYNDLLSRLEVINSELAQSEISINGDVVFGGDVKKWRKFANSLKLRILISLSRKEASSINYREQFAMIVNNPQQYPIMESNADNCAYTYNNSTDNNYPFFNQASFSSRYVEETLVDFYKKRNDPRLFRVADPALEMPAEADYSDFSVHTGLVASNSIDQNSVLISQGIGSPIDSRYRDDPEAEPNVAMGYFEVMFNVAEAAQRGWVNVDAEEYYEEGIRASMNFYGINDETAIQDYLLQPNVAYNQASGLEAILKQKYMSMFLNSGWEAFYNQRRTGIPEFDVSQGGVLNGGEVPKRWMYPQKELNTNRDNLVEALERQFGGDDSVNQEMWILE